MSTFTRCNYFVFFFLLFWFVFDSVSDKNEHKKFLNAIPLHVVQYFQQTDDNKTGGRRFEIVARDPRTGDRRHYH